jgi:dipeptidyl aminopeptidase/acylaminoacyl peptidase
VSSRFIFMKPDIQQTGITDIEEVSNEYSSYSFFYKSDNLKVRGFIIFPKNIQKPCSVIFVNRGGTGEFGKITSESIRRYNFFPENGYVAVFSQYRGCDGGEGVDRMGGDDVFDVINLYDFVKQIPQVDIKRIGMWGVSRGGMMSFQVLTRASWVKALVVVAPLLDEVNMAKWRPGWREHQIEMYGGSYPEQYKRSPKMWLDQLPKIPMMFFHGLKDGKTNPEDSISMASSLGADLITFPDDDHFISAKTVNQSIEFFNKHLSV